MTARQPVFRSPAEADLANAAAWYFAAGGESLSFQFIDAVAAAVQHVSERPGSGSLRYAGQSGRPNLRYWRVRGFPYLVFYVDGTDQLEIWRILHGQRDIPTALQDEDLREI